MNMTRQQAEHILDAYLELECAGGDNKARQSLRAVILDAMTSYCVGNITTTPHITWPSTDCPTIPTYKPTITCEVES